MSFAAYGCSIKFFASTRFDGVVGGRPPIYRGLFNEFKMRLMITGPRALSGSMRGLLGIVFCCGAGSVIYAAISSGYDVILCCAVFLLPSIGLTSEAGGQPDAL